VQWPDLHARRERFVRRLRGLQSTVGERNDGVDLRIGGLDAIEVRLHHLDGRHLPVADQFSEFARSE
jgi:hypothetical protein